MNEVPVLPEQRDLVAGERSPASVDTGGRLTDPNTGRPLAPAMESTPERVERALATADALHRGRHWATAPVADRVALLHAIADGLAARSGEIARADAVDSGVPISVTGLFGGGLPDVVRGAAEQLTAARLREELPGAVRPVRLLHLPWGPAAVIVPFNAPSFIAVKKTAYALAAGAPVICKPSPVAPSSVNLITDAVAEALAAVGAPAGLFQLLHGGAGPGTALAADPRVRALCFTGGRSTGASIVRACAGDLKALQLELGSNNPVVVRADADLDTTADALVAGFTKLNGQWCESPGSVFVPASLHDALLDAILDRLALLRAGHSLDPETGFGPQADEGHLAQLRGRLDRLATAGGEILSSTPMPDLPGWFLAPSVVRGADPADATEEIFGPVLTLHPVRDDEQAVELANSRSTGLAGYVFGADEEAAMDVGERLECGEIKINGSSLLDLTETSTQGFWGASGVGAHGNAELLRFFCGARIVGVDDPGLPL
ncbi:phenylacetaldehyde dehydrogenase [Streptosporangium becharense]|uniref:Phenylacetaldehyde dehydrogenase n=1 Tax=Streptosporangium becharense TaxID=1816182 RepID=A0A7W9IMF1_9ACTN|nr:aldehyde dehydrogenase family protein [Streptosporangium becharense]MBB2914580.1 phenylacetaldehyde dehydrogenase [Streptosporangium becharense]MBB5823425.1 phenylacetaldehyde dehydrogenase [Streptosporangium becharense]